MGLEKTVQNKNFIQSLLNALRGIKIAIVESRNLKIHFTVSILVLFLSWFFKISKYEWLCILLLIGAVVSAEIFNTAIEDIENVIRDEAGVSYKYTGKGKDLAAGAVLILAIVSAIIGFMIFVPKLFLLIYA